jgi:hypothetical protein
MIGTEQTDVIRQWVLSTLMDFEGIPVLFIMSQASVFVLNILFCLIVTFISFCLSNIPHS